MVMLRTHRITWGGVIAGVIGGVVGAVAGLIVSANFAILVGITNGYEASLAEVFRQNPLAGVVDALILIGGPVAGVWAALRVRTSLAR